MRQNFFLPLLLCLIAGAAEATSVTGLIADVTGTPVTNNTFVRFELKNCGSNIPRVSGQAAIAPSVKDIVPNAQGLLTGQIVGNDAITCDVPGNTYYLVTVWNGKVKLYTGNYLVTGAVWDITLASPFSTDPTAFVAPNGYDIGDMLISSEENQMGVLPGNTAIARKFLQTSGDGEVVTSWGWASLTPDDIPSGIPAAKISGLPDLEGNLNYTMPALSGDISSESGSTSLSVVGLRGVSIAPTEPTADQILQYNDSSEAWEPKTLTHPVSSWNGRSGVIVPATGDYSFDQISGVAGLTQIPEGIDAEKIGNGDVDNEKLSYLATARSDLQDQIDAISSADSVTLDGDVTGDSDSNSVVKLRGVAISSTAPSSTGQVLTYNGTQWAPQSVSVAAANVTGLSTAVDARITAQKGENNGLATLGADGKLPTSQVPQIAITNTIVVDDESAQISAAASVGDIVVRTDESKTYVHNGGTAGTMADFTELLLPSGVGVASVNSKTGSVVLSTSDIAEGTNEYFTAEKVAESEIDGDVTGTIGDSTVMAIRGVPVSAATPSEGQVLKLVEGEWTPSASVEGDATSINGVDVDTATMANGMTLVYSSASSSWVPVITTTAGDVTGAFSALTVAKLQGRAVSSTMPETSQVLKWNGSAWAPAADSTGDGDATKLQSVAISSTTPTTGQGLVFNGTNWAPAALGGNATTLQNIAVSATVPTNNQGLVYNGTQWAAKDDVRQISYVVTDPNTDLTTATGSVADVFANRSGNTWSILEVYCKSDSASTSTFNLVAGGSNVFSSAQSCTSTGNAYSSFAVGSLTNSQTLSHTLVSAAAGLKRLSITIRYKQ